MPRRVREIVRAGADHIKVVTSGGVLSPRDDPRHGHFRDAELAVLVEEANAAGIFVMAHAQGAPGIKAALPYRGPACARRTRSSTSIALPCGGPSRRA